MRSKLGAPGRLLRAHARTLHLLAVTVTLTAVALWVIAGLIKAGGANGVSDLVSLAAYAMTALTVVVGPLSLIASPIADSSDSEATPA